MGKAAERDAEKERKRQERRERRKLQHKHLFNDPTYTESRSRILDDLDDALKEGVYNKQCSEERSHSLYTIYTCVYSVE